jgi:hypothetical protein
MMHDFRLSSPTISSGRGAAKARLTVDSWKYTGSFQFLAEMVLFYFPGNQSRSSLAIKGVKQQHN